MQGEPCKVCGCSDLNLIDGFYYCVECGTQDVNVRQTVIEELALPEGAYNFKRPRTTKIKKIVQDGDTVSPEWHKWHCYNYIMAGMADELVSLGADPSVKTKVLWLWSMYMKKFQRKKELGLPVEEEDEDDLPDVSNINKIMEKDTKRRKMRKAFNVAEISNTLFFTILYLALNFDKSDIQLTHLIRFVQERRLSYAKCTKFVPKDIDVYLIDKFNTMCKHCNPTEHYVRLYAMTFIKTFNLGPPVLPDLRKIADRYVTELCLPDDFKNLVYSLMQLVPCDYLNLDSSFMKSVLRTPFYECVVMSYVVVALKMCFGLDDDYEVKLSDAVDHINNENCHMKCYKLGIFSATSDRLFSFRQWCIFLRIRKVVLCKFYWPLAQLFNMDVDDYVYMEQREPPTQHKPKPSLTDEITMNILNKVDEQHEVDVVPKSAFHPTLTPLTTYTDVILEYYKDPELRLLLSEDFTKYSLKYACEKLDLRVSDNSENIIVGVNETGKFVEPVVKGKMAYNEYDWSMVYVRNCENKNWLITNPPTLDHIEKSDDDHSDKENDSHVVPDNKSLLSDVEISKTDLGSVKDDVDISKKTEFLQEDESANIFDDDFHNLEEYEENKDDVSIKTEPIDEEIPEINNDFDNLGNDNDDFLGRIGNLDDDNDDSHIGENIGYFFNPDTFNKEETIRELILATCKKYRIPIPPEFRTKEQKKIIRTTETRTKEPKPKKAKLSRAEVQAKVYNLLSAYHINLSHDAFANLSNEIRNFGRRLDDTRNDIDSTEQNANYQNDDNLENNITLDHHANVEPVVDEDPGILLVENKSIESDLPDQIDDPNPSTQTDLFDENVYDIKQLYLKVQETGNEEEDDFDISNDPEIDKLLTKKIDECNKIQADEVVVKPKRKKVDDNDSDDDIPLSVLKAEKHKWLKKQKKLKEYKQLDYLIENRQEIQKFNYWTRHPLDMFRKVAGNSMNRFNSELKENFPKSFTFVVQECAAILDCTPYVVCQYAMQLERMLFSKLKPV